MTATDLFQRLATQYAMRLPFVVYKKPKKNKIRVIFQNDTRLHVVDTFEESGFIFAPYAQHEKRVLIPGKPLEVAFDFLPENTDFKPELAIFEEERQKHIEHVEQAIDSIKNSGLQKVVLSRKQWATTTKDPLRLFKNLVTEYPDAFTYLFFHPEIGIWLGATPETLLQVNGLRFKTMALAGTQAFQENQEVVWGEKEEQEQQLVVDDIVQNLETFNIKNLKVADRETTRAGNVLHLRTIITGIMQAATDQLEKIVNALHPTPAVCGLPRELAAAFIKNHEGYDREFYTGFLGELNLEEEQYRSSNRRNTENLAYKSIKKSTDLYVNLRCMQYTDKEVQIYVGGGITRDSVAEKEWEETVAKAQTMLRVLSKS
ncbi:MAG TPA: isochorismate synthase [Leeuwenhoekiella sp.]|nr:isochorismate synthase [Leeuwenhoekiella sp.]